MEHKDYLNIYYIIILYIIIQYTLFLFSNIWRINIIILFYPHHF